MRRGPFFYFGGVICSSQAIGIMLAGKWLAGWPGMLIAGFVAILLTIPIAKSAAYLDWRYFGGRYDPRLIQPWSNDESEPEEQE